MSPVPQQDPIILRYFPFYFLSLWIFIAYIVSWIGGWHLLTQRFRTDSEFTGTVYRWFYTTMRLGVHYNGALKVGGDAEGLYIAPMLLFRIGHPPLLIPWTEISVEKSRWWELYLRVTFTLGRAEQVPFRISRRTARKLREAAGSAWPDPQNLLQL
jgi:hypothetical protein